jgi:tripartite ATP-independent transporter DctP family solute receptor
MFSHDYARRQGENLRFLRMRDGFLYHTEDIRRDVRKWWNGFTAGFKNKKMGKNAGTKGDPNLKYCIFPCPGCGAQVRVPANKGRIQIRVYTDSELGDEPDLVRELTRGGLDFIRASMSGLTEYNDEANVLVMPYLYKDADHMWKVLDGDIGQEIMDSFDGTGMVALSWYDAGVRNFYSDEPINCLEDMSGKVVRIQDSDIMDDIIKSLGAIPYPTMFDEVYSALQTGRVDIAENNLSSYESMEHYKVAPYYIVDEHTRIPELQLISQTTYDKLTDEEKDIIVSCARESAMYERQLWKEREKVSLERVMDGGCHIIYLSDEEKERFKKAVEGVYEK